MDSENDFHLSIDRAMALAVDATCMLRAARTGRLPEPHRRLLSAAIGKFEWGQDILFQARNDPWTPPPKPKHQQLTLV